MRRFKGFTLTELMVALAVIGILVAVVTPAIMKTRPNKNKMMVKKTFYSVEQIVSSLINDEGLYKDFSDQCPAAGTEDYSGCAYGFDDTSKVKREGYDYEGVYKFAALFKEHLNVKENDEDSKDTTDKTGPEKEDEEAFYPVFYTTDGVKWDLTGTKDAWQNGQEKVGTFVEETEEKDGRSTCKKTYAGCGSIKIDVDTSNDTETFCSEGNEDCDTYEIQILANGKLRINPTDKIAVKYATINTSIKDNDKDE